MPEEIIESAPVHGRGKIQIPKKVREELGVIDGDQIVFFKDKKNRIIIRSGKPQESYL